MRIGLYFLALVAVLFAWILARPFIHTIILAIIVAGLAWPLHALVSRRVRNSSLAAACTLLILVVAVLLLLTVFFSVIVPQAVELARVASTLATGGSDPQGGAAAVDGVSRVNAIIERGINSLQSGVDWISEALGVSLGNLHDLDISAQLRRLGARVGQNVLSASTAIVGEFVFLMAHLAILFFILYFLLRDGRSMIAWVKRLSPLRDEQEMRLFRALRSIARAVFIGGGLVAVCQGVLAGIGFAIAGLPALVLAMCCVLAAFVPLVGTALIWGPAAAYLHFAGDTWQPFFIVLWGLIIVSGSDSILRALFLKGGTNMPILLLFLAIMGGLSFFGVLGLLYGPLMLTFAGVALNMYVEYATPGRSPLLPPPSTKDERERKRLKRPRNRPARRSRGA